MEFFSSITGEISFFIYNLPANADTIITHDELRIKIIAGRRDFLFFLT